MKKTDDVKETGYKAINFLQVVQTTVKGLKRKQLSYEDEKKAERLETAILRSIDHIRRALMDDEVMR